MAHVRFTITVPAELRARMREVSDRHNWSAVATAAFERAVANTPPKLEDEEMAEIVERLRKTAFEDEENMRNTGREAGRTWARRFATKAQLERVAGSYEQPSPDLTAVEMLTLAVIDPEPGTYVDDVELQDFRDQALRGDPAEYAESEAWAEGFIEGAAQIWEQVSGYL